MEEKNLKYIVVLGDGMADEPIDSLDGKTPLEYANLANINDLAKKSEIGNCYTIPDGMAPGSDTANLSVLGYDPNQYYTGRSPLEALSIGVNINHKDITLRCNLVTLSDDLLPYEEKTMLDHSAGEITTEEARVLIKALKDLWDNESYQFHVGTSYRHLTIWKEGSKIELTPPHDILGDKIEKHLPLDSYLKDMMVKSYNMLNNHPINIEREKKGLNKGNSIWFWGAGTKPELDLFEDKFHKKGAMISAVDLLKGIGVGTGMEVVHVEGANGSLHTNYEGKAMAACKALLEDNKDFVYIHIEAPDEMGHQGNVEDKIRSIEFIDRKIVKVVLEQLNRSGVPYKMLIMPDHPTPIRYRTHTSDPVPYLLYDSRNEQNHSWNYNEKEANISGNVVLQGYKMMNKLFE